MSDIVIALLALFHVYCLEIIICFLTLKMIKRFTNKKDSNPRGTYIASVRAIYVIVLILIIYFVPLVALTVCLVINSLLVGPIILLIIGSSIFVTNKIIIPVSESKHLQLYEKYYGKDSLECNTLIEEQH